jgi:PAS domain S-box-containing protein
MKKKGDELHKNKTRSQDTANMDKRAEESQRESERKYKLITEKMTDIVWIAGMDLKVIYVTPSVHKVLGFTPEETENQTLEEKLTPTSWANGMEKLARELEIEEKGDGDPNRTVSLVLEYYHRDGSTRWLETIISGIRNDQGVLTVLHGVARDITERKLMEDALRASEEKFVKSFRYSPSGMCISSVSDGRYVDVNNIYLTTLGYKREEIIGRTSSDINLWVDMADRDAMVKELIQKGKVTDFKLRFRDKQGDIHWGLTSVSLIKTEEETYLLTQTINITKQKRAEEKLRKSKELFTKLVNTIPDIIVRTNLEGNILFVNDNTLQISGYSREEILDQNILKFISPENHEEVIKNLTLMMEGRLGPREYTLITKDGSKIPFEVNGDVLRNEDGTPFGIVNVCRDITERKLAEDALRQKTALLEAQLNSSIEGILVVDSQGKKVLQNQRAIDLWKIPQHIADNEDDQMQVQHVMHMTVNPEQFVEKVTYLYNHPDETTSDEVELTDGTVLDRYSAPVLGKDGQNYGRIWAFRDITERKRTEEALSSSETELRTLINAMTDVMFVSNSEGRYLKIPETNPSLLYKPPNELLGKTLHEVFPKDQADFFLSHIRQALNTQKSINFEYSLPIGNMESWFSATISPMSDDMILMVARDITERKQAEDALRQSEEKYRNIIQSIEDGYAELDLKGNFLFVNNALCKIDGYPKNELMKLNYRDIMDEENAKKIDAAYHKVFITGKSEKDFEYEIITKSGIRKYLETSVQPIKDAVNRVIAFRGIVRDRTERKLAEEKFYKIFMTTPDCIAITRLKDGFITDVNKGFEDIVGWKREEAIGTKSTEPPLDFWVDLSARELMVEDLKAGRDVLHHQFEFRRSDGSIRTGIYSARPINIASEASIIFIMQDITEQKRMESELVESQKMKLMSQIVSGVAHEVRNPLHAIQAISEAMAIDLKEDIEYKDYLMHIKAQVERLSHLMKDLLELGKPIQPSQFSKALLTEIATASLENWMEAHPQISHQVKVVNELQPDDLVLVDTNKIQQVIINLMENAAQNSPQDEEILLELSKASQNYLMVKVIDKGKGLKSQDQPKVFEPFYTTRKSGTGLGLSICKHIIESHGGSIKIISNTNAPGCTAQFTLPAYNSKEHK